ncbi:MAG: PfkB family carbohydrate kinase [Candidatus Nanopelagicales bacterium]
MISASDGKKGSRPSVVGTGLIVLDIVVSSESDDLSSYAGGTCGNVLSVLSFLGWDAYPVARLNGDAASRRVKADMRRWRVHLDFAECEPTTDTPIIVQTIGRDERSGTYHRFGWHCPFCGHVLPRFKSVTLDAVVPLSEAMGEPTVFFLDRLSSASLKLARIAAERGAIVVFEPSAKMSRRLFVEALTLAHVVKYSEERFGSLGNAAGGVRRGFLEIQTLGDRGLRYRNRMRGTMQAPGWKVLDANHMPEVVDTCGAGDWCTAGFIHGICRKGLEALREAARADVEEALQFGQALAAWNCGFEGARGGMYRVDKAAFERQVKQILSGKHPGNSSGTVVDRNSKIAGRICPACEKAPRTLLKSAAGR